MDKIAILIMLHKGFGNQILLREWLLKTGYINTNIIYNVYIHYSDNMSCDSIIDNKNTIQNINTPEYESVKLFCNQIPNCFLLNTCIKTDWCDVSLFSAHQILLKEALKDPSNKYFMLMSGSDWPIMPLAVLHRKLEVNNKSVIKYFPDPPRTANILSYHPFNQAMKMDQFCILNKEHAIIVSNYDMDTYLKLYLNDIIFTYGTTCADHVLPIIALTNYINPDTVINDHISIRINEERPNKLRYPESTDFDPSPHELLII